MPSSLSFIIRYLQYIRICTQLHREALLIRTPLFLTDGETFHNSLNICNMSYFCSINYLVLSEFNEYDRTVLSCFLFFFELDISSTGILSLYFLES